MSLSLNRFVTLWSVWPKSLRESLASEKVLEQRATSLARLLRRMVPPATAAFCELRNRDATAMAMEAEPDASGHRIAELLRGWITTLDRRDGDAAKSSLGGTDCEFSCLARFTGEDSIHAGALAVALPSSRSRNPLRAAETFLSLAADSLAAHLRIESIVEHSHAAQSAADLSALRSLLHEVNNNLNSMLLQAAVVAMKVDGSLRLEVEQIRREGTEAAAHLAHIQRLNLW
jgi:hypothetical protein